MKALASFALLLLIAVAAFPQVNPRVPEAAAHAAPKVSPAVSVIPLTISSTVTAASEMDGSLMSLSKCDEDGNLYIRKFAMDRPFLGAVVKIAPDGKRAALFDPSAFSKLELDRADAFTPASDGGLYQLAQSGVVKPRIYVLRFSSDGSPSSPVLLDADLEVYAFAAFAGGNILVSGVQRDVMDRKDPGRNVTAVFSADGRRLQELSFESSQSAAQRTLSNVGTPAESANGAAQFSPGENQSAVSTEVAKPAPMLDLSDAEAGSDGNLYVIRPSSSALIRVISPSSRILRTLKIRPPAPGLIPSAFHVSGNQLAVSFRNDNDPQQMLVVADAEAGRRIGVYSAVTDMGQSFACYSANDGIFTFLKVGEGSALEIIRAKAQ